MQQIIGNYIIIIETHSSYWKKKNLFTCYILINRRRKL